MAGIAVLRGFAFCMSRILFYNNTFQVNFSWLITEDDAFDFLSPIIFASEVPISSREY